MNNKNSSYGIIHGSCSSLQFFRITGNKESISTKFDKIPALHQHRLYPPHGNFSHCFQLLSQCQQSHARNNRVSSDTPIIVDLNDKHHKTEFWLLHHLHHFPLWRNKWSEHARSVCSSPTKSFDRKCSFVWFRHFLYSSVLLCLGVLCDNIY